MSGSKFLFWRALALEKKGLLWLYELERLGITRGLLLLFACSVFDRRFAMFDQVSNVVEIIITESV